MKILHFSTHYRISPGIVKQISDEGTATLALNETHWKNIIFTCYGENSDFIVKKNYPGGKIVNYLTLRTISFFWLVKNAKKYDIVLLRHNLGDPFEFIASKFLKRYITVHHTLELEEAKTAKGITGWFQLYLEKKLGTSVISKATGIIGVTGEIIEYEQFRIGIKLPSHIYPNGIDCNNYSAIDDKRAGIPRFLFVAAFFSSWHGLDRLIEALAKDKTECEIHIVGRCTIEQIKNLSNDQRFHYHGEMTADDIKNLSVKIDVGISSLALERKGMREACTLKVREYLASGIPIYSGHTDAALPVDFPYYRKEDVNLSGMIYFAEEMRKVPRAFIREQSRTYINKITLTQSLASWLEKLPYNQ